MVQRSNHASNELLPTNKALGQLGFFLNVFDQKWKQIGDRTNANEI
jgi:hypothetical protein